jgi:hypothetical protein
MSRTGAAVTLLSVLITLSGCAVGYNSTLFYTQSNIGLDAETKPPTAEISIARREGVIEPGFEGGQTPPVIAGFRNHSGPFSRFFFGVQSTFAGGDAAEALSQGPRGPDVNQVSGLCLSEEPKPPWFSFLSIPKKGEVMPFAFGTDTVFGLKVAWSGTAGPFPDSLRLGFNRKEAAWAPLFGTDKANCTIPGTMTPGSYVVWMPSFLAALDANVQAGQPSETSVDWVQYFATGTSATTLAKRDDVRSIMLKQAFPAAVDVVTYDNNPEVACVEKWINSAPEHPQILKDWWKEQQLQGMAWGILAREHATERKKFMEKNNITCN